MTLSSITPDSISNGIHYAFDDIDSLRFYYTVTKKTVNFRPAGTDYNAELDIYLVGAERPISVRNSPCRVSQQQIGRENG